MTHAWVCAGCGTAMTPIPEGSFLYPPILRTADDTIAYWETMAIEDEVLNKVSSVYVAQWAEEVGTGPESFWKHVEGPRWESENPPPANVAEVAAWEDERDRARAEFVKGLRETQPDQREGATRGFLGLRRRAGRDQAESVVGENGGAPAGEIAPESLWEQAEGPRWESENPPPVNVAEVAAWQDERDRARAEFVNGLRETLRSRPGYLDPRDVRQCARIIGMVSTLEHLPVEEADKVRDHQVELTTGKTSVRETNRNLGLSAMVATVTDPAIYEEDPAADERLAVKVLTALQPFLEEQFEEHEETIIENLEALNQNVGEVAKIIIDTMR